MSEVCTYDHIQVNSYDPTRTTTLRNAFAREMRKRFNELTRVIQKAIVQDDVFGMHVQTFVELQSPGYSAFNFPRVSQKVEAFMEWLRLQEQRGILETAHYFRIGEAVEEAWTNYFIYDSYKRGVQRARYELKKAGYEVPTIAESGGIEVVMSAPFHIDRVGLIFTRAYEQLKGITSAMDVQISQILGQGMVDGDGARLLARKLVATINGSGAGELGITDSLGRFIPAKRRAEMLARTEIIRAHHMANIQEYKNWKAMGITIIAEFSTAGDDRVCFPGFTKVLTTSGNVQIRNIKKGDLVQTPNGQQIVNDVGSHVYYGKMVALHFESDFIFCTVDHLIWSNDRKRWIEAGEIQLNEFVQNSQDEAVEIIGAVNFILSDAGGVPSIIFNGNVSFGILCQIMPVFPVNFKRNLIFWKRKIYRVSSDGEFLIERKSKIGQREPYFFLKGSFPVKSSVTCKTAENSWRRRSLARYFSAVLTGVKNWRPSTFFRAMVSFKPAINIRLFMMEKFSTTFAFFDDPALRFFSAFHRTIVVPIGNGCFHYERFPALFTNFSHQTSSREVITNAGAKRPSFRRYKVFSTLFAWAAGGCLSVFRITFMRTKSVVTFWIVVRSSIKYFSTMITNMFILLFLGFRRARNRAEFPCGGVRPEFFTALIAGNREHISLAVAHSAIKYTKKQLMVYDISVENEHCFYANGILVHNCSECASYHGNRYTLKEVEFMIPVHPNCRCIAIPVERSDPRGVVHPTMPRTDELRNV